MKSYMELVPISAKAHRKQNRMSIFCIALAVFLVTVIFGMADMFIRSQIIGAEQENGSWHLSVRNISDEDAQSLRERRDVECVSCYGVFNYRGDEDYSLGGKSAVIMGCDSYFFSHIMEGMLVEGEFPADESQGLVTLNAKKAMGLAVGDVVSVNTPDGEDIGFTVSGFLDNTAGLLSDDCCGVCLSTAGFRAVYPNPTGSSPADYNSVFFIRLSKTGNVAETEESMKAQLGLSAEQLSENTKLLALLGQSSDSFIMQIYGTAAVLFVLVLLAGVMMISSSLNSSVAVKTQFYGLLRCIGTTKKQLMRIVRREALFWCVYAIPLGVAAGMVIVWALCFLLRGLSPDYFGEMPVFAVSLPSIAAGVVLGLLTVLLSARSPAKRASMASPLFAVSGGANADIVSGGTVKTSLFPVDMALGMRHATASKKNYFLMSASFALSIILFLGFSVTVGFMGHALTPLRPWTPDVSVSAAEGDLPDELLGKLASSEAVGRIYGRMSATLTADYEGTAQTVYLLSYEENQFKWAEKYLVDGSAAKDSGYAMAVFSPNGYPPAGSILHFEGGGELEISGVLSEAPFSAQDGIILICSEESFKLLTGRSGYAVIDIQLAPSATDGDVDALRTVAGDGVVFSDERLNNSSVEGSYYSFALFIYGFLVLIALVTVFNIINSISMSVSARARQYGVLRAIGLASAQLERMVLTESCTYALTGTVLGSILGIMLNKFLFGKLVSFRWGDPWTLPLTELAVILAVIAFSVLIAAYAPVKRVKETPIVEAVSAL